jgi:DNA-binding PadR family transcriptional regulator
MPQSNRQSRHLPAFILLALADGPLHGHAIRAALHLRIPGFKSDPGAIYRTLQALEADGEVSFQWHTEASGPARKVYRLTGLGWERLGYWEADIRQRMAFLNAFLDGLERARRNGPGDRSGKPPEGRP